MLDIDLSAFLDHAMSLALYESRHMRGEQNRIRYIRKIINPSYALAQWIAKERETPCHLRST